MKLMIIISSLLTLTSCSPENSFINNEMPTPPTTEQPNEPDIPKNNTMKITIGSTPFTATLATNTSGKAFKEMLPLTINMTDFNSNEKTGPLPNSLTTAASNPGTINIGDIMLYGSSSIVLFYETFSTSYNYTEIGQIDNVAGLKAALGSGDATIKFELE